MTTTHNFQIGDRVEYIGGTIRGIKYGTIAYSQDVNLVYVKFDNDPEVQFLDEGCRKWATLNINWYIKPKPIEIGDYVRVFDHSVSQDGKILKIDRAGNEEFRGTDSHRIRYNFSCRCLRAIEHPEDHKGVKFKRGDLVEWWTAGKGRVVKTPTGTNNGFWAVVNTKTWEIIYLLEEEMTLRTEQQPTFKRGDLVTWGDGWMTGRITKLPGENNDFYQIIVLGVKTVVLNPKIGSFHNEVSSNMRHVKP